MTEHVESLLQQILEEQRRQTQLLIQLIESNNRLIEALASEDDEVKPVITYMDGSRL